MANNKYVGEEAVTAIAGYVNKKLTVASSMPISPKNDMIVLYIGATTSSYVHGSIYKYNGITTNWDIVSAIDAVVQSYADLPSTFGPTDRKMYYVISESCFYLWDGTAWVKKEVDLSIVKNMIADEFDASKNYDQFEFVIYEDELYVFDEPHTAGPWDSSEVMPLNVAMVLTMLYSQIIQGMVNPEIIADEFDATKSYKQQEIVWHDDELYMFIKDHAAGAWNRSDVLQIDLAAYIKALYDKNRSFCFSIMSTIAPRFNELDNYSKGDLVYFYDDSRDIVIITLYRFLVDHSAGPWVQSEVEYIGCISDILEEKEDKPTTISWNDYIALTDAQREGNHYIITGAPGMTPIYDYVEVTADGQKTYGQLLNELRNSSKFDATKINEKSYIFDGQHYYRFATTVYWQDVVGGYAFSMPVGNETYQDIENIILHPTNSVYTKWENGTIMPLNSYAAPQGTVITLYYGSKLMVVDMQTKAKNSTFDPTGTGLQSTNAEDAIKEVNEKASDILRMKNWGTFTSQAQLETFLTEHEVSTGKFTGLRVGDYCTIAGFTCYIAGFDTEYNKGYDMGILSVHHISFIADLGNSKMNETDTTAGGYELGASTMQTFLSGKETAIRNVIGASHLLGRACLTTNSVGADGKSDNWAWNTHKLTLMTETQIYGGVQCGNSKDTGEGYEKLPIFNYIHPVQLFGRRSIWLRGVGSSTNFCVCDKSGIPDKSDASYSFAAVALFCIR